VHDQSFPYLHYQEQEQEAEKREKKKKEETETEVRTAFSGGAVCMSAFSSLRSQSYDVHCTVFVWPQTCPIPPLYVHHHHHNHHHHQRQMDSGTELIGG
jgi:hypothetical protein